MVTALEYAKKHGLIVRFAAEDSTRTDLDFLKRFYKAGEEAGADYVSIADTVGIMNPSSMKYLVTEIKNTVKIPICVHCHDDLGLAVANAMAAAEAGAKQLHTTMNGIGERAGNAALEEVLMGLVIHYGIDRYDTSHLHQLSEMVTKYSGIAVAKNKAVVGGNAFAHESGIHIAALLENDRTYELYSPGAGRRPAGSSSSESTAAVRRSATWPGSLDITLSRAETDMVLEEIKRMSDVKQSIRKDELAELITRVLAKNKEKAPSRLRAGYLQIDVWSGRSTSPRIF